MKASELNHPFYKEARERIDKRHQNVLILIVGDPGTGKSLLALRIAEKLDPTFNQDNVRERVIVKAEQFAKVISEDGENKLEKGSAIVIDEAGASMGSRDWYSIGNKMISHIMQTFRYRQLIVILTVPNISFVDIHCRKLVNYMIQTEKIDFKTCKTRARVWELNYNKISNDGEPYKKRFRIRDENNEIVILNSMWFDRADCKIVHAYEKYSYEFKREITERALNAIENVQRKQVKEVFNPKEIALKVIENKEKYYINNKLSLYTIQNDFGLGVPRAKQVRASVLELIDIQNGDTDINSLHYKGMGENKNNLLVS